MIDTHTHLYSEEFDEDRAEMIHRAINKGVIEFYLPAIDSESHEKMLQLESRISQSNFRNDGITSLLCKARNVGKRIRNCRKLFELEKFPAIGEIGIDLYWDKTTLDIQIKAFEKQIDWAIERDLPIVQFIPEKVLMKLSKF